jgi:hypothetical protein
MSSEISVDITNYMSFRATSCFLSKLVEFFFKMEAVCFSEMLLPIYESTRRQNAEGSAHSLHTCGHRKLIPHAGLKNLLTASNKITGLNIKLIQPNLLCLFRLYGDINNG